MNEHSLQFIILLLKLGLHFDFDFTKPEFLISGFRHRPLLGNITYSAGIFICRLEDDNEGLIDLSKHRNYLSALIRMENLIRESVPGI